MKGALARANDLYPRPFFLLPLQGSALLPDPTPGLHPGLFSCRPCGAWHFAPQPILGLLPGETPVRACVSPLRSP
jgi:hypothetical protein